MKTTLLRVAIVLVLMAISFSGGYYWHQMQARNTRLQITDYLDKAQCNSALEQDIGYMTSLLEAIPLASDQPRRQLQVKLFDKMLVMSPLYESKFTQDQQAKMTELLDRIRTSFDTYPFVYDEPGKGMFTKSAMNYCFKYCSK